MPERATIKKAMSDAAVPAYVRDVQLALDTYPKSSKYWDIELDRKSIKTHRIVGIENNI